MKRTIWIPILVLVLVSLACAVGGKAEPTAVPTVEMPTLPPAPPTQPPPPPTQVPPASDLPTETPLPPPPPADSPFYREEFDGDLSTWKYLYVTGNTQENASFELKDGKFVVWLPKREETHLKVYTLDNIYSDVIVQAEVENLGDNNNGIAVLCRVSDRGWYEFRISTQQLYEIYRYDPLLKEQGQNPYIFIAQGGSPLIKPGNKINTLAMACTGDNFEFYINGEKVKTNIGKTIREQFTKLSEGGIGLGVVSKNESGSPVEVNFNWIEMLEP